MNRAFKFFFNIFATSAILISLTACGAESDSTIPGIPLKAGQVIEFGGNIAGGIENGWSNGDGLRTWSDGFSSVLVFENRDKFPNGVNLTAEMGAFVNEKNPKMMITIKANGVLAKEFSFDQNTPGGVISIDIPAEILKKNPDRLIISFDLPDSKVPKEIGWNEDVRRLGVFITSIKVSQL